MIEEIRYIQSGLHLGFCSRGGKIAVFAFQVGQALHAVHYNIYIVKFQGGGRHPAKGGECRPPKKNPDSYSKLKNLHRPEPWLPIVQSFKAFSSLLLKLSLKLSLLSSPYIGINGNSVNPK